jgi:AIPR protein
VAGRTRFARETPKSRRFSKTDLAKYLNAWDGLPHAVSRGGQKNFQASMQALKDNHSEGFVPDREWYEGFIAKAVLFREVQAIAKSLRFPAYQATE